MTDQVAAATPSVKQASIEITVRCDLDEDAIWPDGRPPADWTAEHVVAEIEKSGSLSAFLYDWDADSYGAEVGVHADGRYARGWLR